jgi:transposase, IS30 family
MAQITFEQRYKISALFEAGKSRTEIAVALNKHKSTIGRELRRNSDKRNNEYRPDLAEKKCRERHRKKPKKIVLSPEIKKHIKIKLKERFSPEQIWGRAKLEGHKMVSPESIYQYIWEDKKEGGSLYLRLRRHGKSYRKRGSLKDSRGQIPDRICITKRPEIVNEKTRIGDLEIDTVIGANHKGALVTIVDRVTRYTKIHLLTSREANLVEKAIYAMLVEMPYAKTMTSDNGKEFANHKSIAEKNKIEFYFAEVYKSWQRGLNENTNGLIRQFIAKKTDFTYLSDKYIKYIEDNLNNRPRKTLGYKTPNEVLLQELNKLN